MRLENLRRIKKGYSPREPTTLLEKAFYLLWTLGTAVKVLAWRGRRWSRRVERERKG